MPLTEMKIKNAKARQSGTTKLFDGGGLYLEISKTGTKGWRLKYRFGGKETRISFGNYPLISLKEARRKRDEAKRLLAEKKNPSVERKAQKALILSSTVNTFENIAREWLDKHRGARAENTTKNNELRLTSHVFPYLGHRPIQEITVPEILSALEHLQARNKIETAHRVRILIGQVFRFAIQTGRATSDPTIHLKGALKPVPEGHRAAVTDPKKLGPLLRMLWGYNGSRIVSAALRLAPLTFVRPGDLRSARWADIDFSRAEWRLVTQKNKRDLVVPLSRQALEVLREIHPVTGRSVYVFPSPRSFDRPLSENGVLAAMRAMGIEKDVASGHGFRTTACTLLREAMEFPYEAVELQLDHAVPNPNGRAYDRGAYLKQRKTMMQDWSDFCDKLRTENDLEQAKS